MTFTILIATYNRAEILRSTLKSLAKQSYKSGQYDIVIVGNNSTDETPRVVSEFKERLPGRYITVVKKRESEAVSA